MKFPRFIPTQSKGTRVYVLAVLFMFLIFSFGIFKQSREFVQSQLYATGQGVQSLTRFIFFKKGNLQDENDELKNRLAQTENIKAQNEELLQENAELRAGLNTIATRPNIFDQAKTAYVIQKSSSTQEHTLKINMGTVDGISVHNIVTTTEGHLVGIIVDIDAHTATVRLLQDKQSSIPANVLGTRGTRGLVQGQSGFVLQLSLIPAEDEIQEGLEVVTSGLEGRFPPGIIIGIVETITVTEKDPFKQATIKPLIDSRDLISVLIL